MSEKTIMELNLKDFGGPVYSGRARGEELRKNKNLDTLDKDPNITIKINIPDSAFAITSSFFLGLLGPSIVHFKSKEAFLAKYEINAKELFRDNIEQYIRFALTDKSLSMA